MEYRDRVWWAGVLIWQEASLSCIIPPFLLILDLQSYWTRKTFPLLFQAGKPHKKLSFVTYQSCKHVNYLLFSLRSTGNTPKNEDRRDSLRAAGTLSIFWVYTGVFLTNTFNFFTPRLDLFDQKYSNIIIFRNIIIMFFFLFQCILKCNLFM